MIRGEPRPFHRLGLPPDFYPADGAAEIGIDFEARLSLEEVKAVRGDRMAEVRAVLGEVTEAGFEEVRTGRRAAVWHTDSRPRPKVLPRGVQRALRAPPLRGSRPRGPRSPLTDRAWRAAGPRFTPQQGRLEPMEYRHLCPRLVLPEAGNLVGADRALRLQSADQCQAGARRRPAHGGPAVSFGRRNRQNRGRVVPIA